MPQPHKEVPSVPTWAGWLPARASSQASIGSLKSAAAGMFAPWLLAGAKDLLFGAPPTQVVKHLSAQHCPTSISTSSGWHWETSQILESPPAKPGKGMRRGEQGGREITKVTGWGEHSGTSLEAGGLERPSPSRPAPLVTVDCEW